MTPYYADSWLTVYQGDCREVMASMEPQSVHCVVTSPPYWGLRDYGTTTWLGGDEGCDHRIGRVMGNDNKGAVRDVLDGDRTACKCGAIRQDSQLGLESTPEEYVTNMVAVFREVRRVLRDDGTVWLNLGDSYASGEIGRHDGYNPTRAGGSGTNKPFGQRQQGRLLTGLKPKDLVGIPWRVAFALQADGWYLRSDIIWAKPNPMPESVTDRPTKAHEYVFLLSKSARYWYDAEAVREEPAPYKRKGGSAAWTAESGHTNGVSSASFHQMNPAGRNLRSVWTVATQPYPGAHFATFPEKLVDPCIKAGCPELGTVLDPFGGSGTTGRVAQRLSRRAVLIDLNGEYLVQAMGRNRDIPLGLEAS